MTLLPEEPFHEHYDPSKADWLVVASFSVIGEPAGWPRATPVRRGKFTKMVNVLEGKPMAWKETLFWQAKRHVPTGTFEGPVRVWIKAYFPRPKEFQREVYPSGPFEFIQKPDDDNIRKMILDVFTILGFFRDDKQVCGGETAKLYCSMDESLGPTKPRAEISIEVNQNWPYKKPVTRTSKVCSTKPPKAETTERVDACAKGVNGVT